MNFFRFLGFNVRGTDTTSYRQIDWWNNLVKIKLSSHSVDHYSHNPQPLFYTWSL